MIKWIGQHIWDFVSRFRNDVYLENIADGTVENDKFLGLDNTGKIVKETVSAGGATISNDANDRITTAMGNGNLNAEANLTWNNLQLGLEYSGADGPTILLTKTGDNATAPIINFVAQRAGNGGAANNDDDYLGYTRYWGYNNAGTPEAIKFAEIQAQISERDDGVEEGKLDLLVQAQGALRTGFSCVGNGSAVVDTTIGTGSTSTTTVAGDLSVTTGLILDGVDVTNIQTSGEVFAGNDTTLMTSSAIENLIDFKNIVSDSVANTNFPVLFHDESNNLLDDTGAFTYNPSTGDLKVTGNITVGSTSNDQYEITLSNDENTAQIGLSNNSNDFVNGAQDGDLVINSVGDHQIILAQNDTSCVRLDTDGKFVGAPQLVKLSKDDLYLTYVSTQNYYYSFGAIGLNFGTSIGSELDSSAIRSCSFIAPYGCTVKKVTMAFYITSSCTLEFYFGKVPLVDDSTSNVTIVEMTSTDHNGSYTANKNYVKSFDISGPNAILSEGHGLAIFARRTDASGTSIIYGNAFGEIRIN